MNSAQHTWWQFCVVSEDPKALIVRLRAAGFDATDGSSRLAAVEPPDGALPAHQASRAMKNVVYVPAYHRIRAQDRIRLASLLA